jgi:hypothetical protein
VQNLSWLILIYPNLAPQLAQKSMPGLSGAPQRGQVVAAGGGGGTKGDCSNAAPHFSQNFMPGLGWVPQRGQTIAAAG